ncbi:MAG: right-handed parallel beta-helix repeat-containing protein [Kiritimatiellae bacterium]|nr:right-handed parallel beta-helix repeat-containing protein [Kiritimatiellia bacterium]MDD5519903.1 right-handed parallel beta-helix repeat-containing protein [Kiritimatiellia bacterium]
MRINIFIILMISILQSIGGAAEFFVSPDGSDANPGTKRKPFQTLERARTAIRKTRSENNSKPEAITVWLRKGSYLIEKTMEFTSEDSGTEKAPVTYAAYSGEKAVISGGRSVTGWQKGDGELWTTVVPGVKEGKWYFHQLFVNGKRCIRARTPNKGYLYTEGILAPFNHAKWYESNIDAKRGFLFRNGDIKRWSNFNDALIVIYHSWTTSIHFITDLDSGKRKVRLVPVSVWPIGYWWEYNTRYHVENILEALDQPGEWYLDRNTGILRYWPMSGENMEKAEVIAPVVRQTLVAFKGQPEAGKFIEYLNFRDLSFQHTDCYIAPDMSLDHQGATEQKPMIAAEGLRHTVFENCEIAHAGENGLWLDSGCCDNVIRHCHIHDLGASAVFIGPKVFKDKPEMAVLRNAVDNCFIHDGSHIFRGSQGLWIGKSSYNQLTHNDISDFHHIGISIGHSWGYAPSTANNNLIAFNHVHHICNGYFSDGGGVYTLGISPGTVIRNNIIHDVVPTPMMPVGGTGIYHDEGSSGILVESNIVYNVGAGAYNQHYGRENLARNNIFAFGGSNTITCCRVEEHLSFTFEGNIVLSSDRQATSDHYSPLKCKTEFRRNLYWDISGKEPSFSGVSFAEWQKTGRDRDSRIADPQFHDAKKRDFRLKSSSPAFAMRFNPIETDKVGLYGKKKWISAPLKIKREPLPSLPPPPPAPPPRPLIEDFESTVTGKQPIVCNYSPSDRPDLIKVTEETAVSGKKSLKFTKVKGLKYGWQPHLYYTFRGYQAGLVRFACDVMNSATTPAEFSISLRDYKVKRGEYRDGPVITFKPDGTVIAAGKDVAKIPNGKWVHINMLVNLGEPGAASTVAKSYRLAVAVIGEKEKVFENIPCASKEFVNVTWFGFSYADRPDGVYYVDNLSIEPVK